MTSWRLWFGHLDADRRAAGDRREDAHVGRRHRVGDVLVEAGDPGDLDAGAELELVAGDRRADGHADEPGLDAVRRRGRPRARGPSPRPTLVIDSARPSAASSLAGGSFHVSARPPGRARSRAARRLIGVGVSRCVGRLLGVGLALAGALGLGRRRAVGVLVVEERTCATLPTMTGGSSSVAPSRRSIVGSSPTRKSDARSRPNVRAAGTAPAAVVSATVRSDVRVTSSTPPSTTSARTMVAPSRRAATAPAHRQRRPRTRPVGQAVDAAAERRAARPRWSRPSAPATTSTAPRARRAPGDTPASSSSSSSSSSTGPRRP